LIHVVQVLLDGDGEIRARVRSFEASNPWAKAGVMVREALTGISRHATAFITPKDAANGFGMVWRSAQGASTSYAEGPALSPSPDNWVRLVREGDVVTSYASSDGVVWTEMDAVTLTGLASSIHVGLAVTSSDTFEVATATFDEVEIIGTLALVPPTVVLSSASAIESGPFTVNVAFSQPVTGLDSTDFVVVNGAASGLTGSGDSYEVLITPTAAGLVNVTVPDEVAFNTANVGNTESNTLAVSFALPGILSLSGQDVGDVLATGGTAFDPAMDIYTVTGSGRDIFFDEDGFQFATTQLSGDGEIRARIVSQVADNPWAKAGLMFREALTGSARHATVFSTPADADNGFGMVWRELTGGSTNYAGGPGLNPAPDNWVRLVRVGDAVTSYTSVDGTSWTELGTATFASLALDLFVGLAVTSSSNGELSSASFDNVTVVGPQTVVSPEVTLTVASLIEAGPFTVDVEVTQAVTGLTESDFVVTNGVASSLTGTGLSYALTVTPTLEGEVTVQLPADAATNASGAGNSVSNTISVNYLPPLILELAGTDIGELLTPGSTLFEPNTEVYTLTASGRDIFFDEDGLQFARIQLDGDGEIRARVTSQSNTNPWAKAGVMIREDLTAGSRHATAFTTPVQADNGFGMVWREQADGSSDYAAGPALNPPPDNWVRLVRTGDTLTGYSSTDGSS
jgi:regulation of enolase protein 1 (concanavalin A-like superfamily)